MADIDLDNRLRRRFVADQGEEKEEDSERLGCGCSSNEHVAHHCVVVHEAGAHVFRAILLPEDARVVDEGAENYGTRNSAQTAQNDELKRNRNRSLIFQHCPETRQPRTFLCTTTKKPVHIKKDERVIFAEGILHVYRMMTASPGDAVMNQKNTMTAMSGRKVYSRWSQF